MYALVVAAVVVVVWQWPAISKMWKKDETAAAAPAAPAAPTVAPAPDTATAG